MTTDSLTLKHINFDKALSIGQHVEIRWIDKYCGYFAVKAEIAEIFEHSVVGKVLSDIIYNNKVKFKAGYAVNVPRTLKRGFCGNYGVFPLD